MKVEFVKSEIRLYGEDDSVIKTISENEFTTGNSNNVLFSLLEFCVNGENKIELICSEDTSPFFKKLYSILEEEFSVEA